MRSVDKITFHHVKSKSFALSIAPSHLWLYETADLSDDLRHFEIN